MYGPHVLDIQPLSPTPDRLWNPRSMPGKDMAGWAPVDLSAAYNATILDALARVKEDATPPDAEASRIGFDYWRDHLGARHHGDPVQMPSDAAWRAKVGLDGIAWTTDGIPFKTVKEGNNIAVVTRTGAYPVETAFPVNEAGNTLYLMISGMLS